MIQNPGYYDALRETTLSYPHPGPSDIEKDLKRSGAGISEERMNSMRNVLCAFIIRNPTVGYCQGMNFLTARLLTCMKEEEAFLATNLSYLKVDLLNFSLKNQLFLFL